MGKYLQRRLIGAVPTVIAASVVIFFLLYSVPGGPEYVYVGQSTMTQEQIEQLRHDMGLDQPVLVQYAKWSTSLLAGNWGISFSTTRPVLSVIAERIPATLELMISATLLALFLAIPLGILAATSKSRLLQYGSSFFSVLGISIPGFWLGLIFILVFSLQLNLLPSGGTQTLGTDFHLGDHVIHLIGPVLVMATYNLAGWSRYMRSSMLEVVGKDYIRTAHAKGLGRWAVFERHALRNAIVPVITLLGMEAPRLFAGAMVVEVVFSWPGIGRLLTTSLMTRDYPVLMGCLTIMTVLVILGNTLADIACAAVDPRIKLS